MNTTEDKSVLWRTRTYLVGHMQYASGRDWREYVETELHDLNIVRNMATLMMSQKG